MIGFGFSEVIVNRLIVSITSPDRPGIVAAISEGIFASEGNIRAASQTVHQGYFSMIVLAEFDSLPDIEQVKQAIRSNAGEDLHVLVIDYEPQADTAATGGNPFVLTCVGPDKPGILRALSRFLSARNVNIDDLYCTTEDQSFVVICDLTVPESSDLFVLQTDLESLGSEGGFSITLQHENVFLETNRP